jgi:hypothetical protein
MGVKLLLHVGCGSKLNTPPREFAAYREIRLDKNPLVESDIVADVVAMPQVPSEKHDAIFCSHLLEHLYAHEVAMALKEFARVLKPGGKVWIQAPDLQSIGGKLALDQADVVLYRGGLGPVSALDMLYGHRGAIAQGNLFMGHKTGFTASVLKGYLDMTGFVGVEISRDVQFELKATAIKPGELPAGSDGRLYSARIGKDGHEYVDAIGEIGD